MNVKTPEVAAALKEVLEASGVLLSAEVSSLVHKHRKMIAFAVIALCCVLLGIALVAVGIRDALVVVFPNHAATLGVGAGVTVILVTGTLSFAFMASRKPVAAVLS